METHFCSPRGYCLSSWCDGGGVRGCQRGARLWTYVLRAQKASSCAALHCQPQTGPQLPRQPASAWARPLSSACVAAVSTCSPQSQQLISHSQRSCYMQQLKLHPAQQRAGMQPAFSQVVTSCIAGRRKCALQVARHTPDMRWSAPNCRVEALSDCKISLWTANLHPAQL